LDILGISAYYHDSAACVIKDGKILAASQVERFTSFLIITIIGLFTRLLGKDFLNLKSESNESYWNIRNKEHELN